MVDRAMIAANLFAQRGNDLACVHVVCARVAPRKFTHAVARASRRR
jgi:hypothetical protein